tara:strand:- start:323 stop:784 length:462 start_codon:yes stop_codon:yes gene_type:complete
MVFSDIVENKVFEILKNYQDLFLIDLKVNLNNNIKLIIDGDNGVSLKDCANVSRDIENNIDAEKFNFSIEVSSSGIGSPLISSRQYKKNVGRKIEVYTNEAKPLVGELTIVNDDSFTIEWSQRESKPIGKGKINVIKNKTLLFSDVKSSKVVI